MELAVLDRVVDPLDAYAASDAAGDLDALDDALDALLAAGWRVEHLHRSYMLVSPTGETWTPPAFAPPVARGPS